MPILRRFRRVATPADDVTTARSSLRAFLRAAVLGGVAAGIVATLVQVVLWLLFTDAFPAILWRDLRLTAAIALGEAIVATEAPIDWRIVAIATVIHFWLSVLYAAVFCALSDGLSLRAGAAVGAPLGALLYFVNLYGFTVVFPWFEVARDWITLTAHLAFGVSATMVSRWSMSRDRRVAPEAGT